MKQPKVVLGFLFPPRQDPSEAVHPTVGPFDHPAAGLETRLALDRPAPGHRGAGRGRCSRTPSPSPAPGRRCRLCPGTVLRLLPCGLGTADRHALDRRPDQLEVVSIGAGDRQPIGHAAPSVSTLRLTPRLARSVGLGPLFFPPQGGLGHRPIHGLPTPVDPFASVVFHQAHLPQLQKYAGLVHSWNHRWAEELEQMPVAFKAFH